jgi:hypothetical protein
MEKAHSFPFLRVGSSLVLALLAFAVRYPNATRVVYDAEGHATTRFAADVLAGVVVLILVSLGCIWFGRRVAQILGFIVLIIGAAA